MNKIKIQTEYLYYTKMYLKFSHGAWMKLWISISKWLLYKNIKHSKELPGKCSLRDFQLRRGSLSSTAMLPPERYLSLLFFSVPVPLAWSIPGPCNNLPLIPAHAAQIKAFTCVPFNSTATGYNFTGDFSNYKTKRGRGRVESFKNPHSPKPIQLTKNRFII